MLIPLYGKKKILCSNKTISKQKIVVSMVLNETTFTGGLSDVSVE